MGAALLVEKEALQGRQVSIEDDDYRHLFRSRRLAVGDALNVVDGEGSMRAGKVAEVHRDRALVILGDFLQAPRVVRHVSIWTAAPRPERAAWLVEKCTELGVREFVFLAAQRSVRPVTISGVARLQRVAKSALLQCGGAWLPKIRVLATFENAIAELTERVQLESVVVLAPGAPSCLQEEADCSIEGMIVVVGPEGGFVTAEVAALETVGALPVGLGSQILRVETAATVAAGNLLGR